MSTGDELKAAVSARRDLGPDFEDAIVESFLDKMGKEVDRRVDERLAERAPRSGQAVNPNVAAGQRLALAIVSLVLGAGVTIALPLLGGPALALIPVWVGIIIVNVVFNGPRKD
ncbi:hypothetical protein SAMN05444920_102648 [Nonomuraea solani]|uniref:Integral membrane protein n=1 Tax=Nonomuraea solani TaxID=1144553 RepID=A0A1H5ZE34_9ACTN|nr:hypothetical protein [Nonomuraea solani]SEG34314.1 hypothetical protein SAMN05444920_102648 [Nonomuraea solani]